MAPAASMKQRHLVMFGHPAARRRETRGLPSRAIALWFKLWSRMNGSKAALAFARMFMAHKRAAAEILTMPAFRIWFSRPCGSRRQMCRECGIIECGQLFEAAIAKMCGGSPRQFLTEDVQVGAGRGAHEFAEVSIANEDVRFS